VRGRTQPLYASAGSSGTSPSPRVVNL